jgi:hypothetical protein
VIDLAIESGSYRNPTEVIATALSVLAEDIEDGMFPTPEVTSPGSRWPKWKRICERSANWSD